VEFYGPGLAHQTIDDRVTLGNMCPEYGATVAIFPIDGMTLDYLRLTGRDDKQVALVEAYAQAQGLFRSDSSPEAIYTETLELDLSTVEPSLAGPRRPQDRVSLSRAKVSFSSSLDDLKKGVKPATGAAHGSAAGGAAAVAVQTQLEHGAVVIAAITSCTNTSNPSVMIGAGLVAKRAVEKGLQRKPWVKTSLAPGSKVVTDYLSRSGLQTYLDQLGFNLVGYGCTTCIGNSGPLPDEVSAEIRDHGLVVASVLSGNRNFEGRIQQEVRANYLASPPLVVAYALAGSMNIDLTTEPLGSDRTGRPVFLKDIWPSEQEIQQAMLSSVTADAFRQQYASVFEGDNRWRTLPVPTGDRFEWEGASTYIRRPPFLENLSLTPTTRQDLTGARALAVLGDSITTDHISPAGSIKVDSPAGRYLVANGVAPKDFNSYGARRGNHEVMMRGTFANVRIKNQMVPGVEGGVTVYLPGDEVMPIYDASMKYQEAGVPLIILAGKEYGSGSSRDWAAKGTMLLGVKAVIAESFERIHRSNLVNMGVLPLQFVDGEGAATHGLTGRELFAIEGAGADLKPRSRVTVKAVAADGSVKRFTASVRIDTPEELTAYSHGGILPYVLRQLVRKA
jgi:aconitate hydratase